MSPMVAHVRDLGGNAWLVLAVPLWVYGVIVLALFGFGRTRPGNPLVFFFRQISDTLTRVTGYPGWAMASVLSGLLILLIAVIGFYWDVAWHIDLGRDDAVFTVPHVMILVGLGGLGYAAALAVIFATIERADVGFRVLGIRVPWSAVGLAALSIGGVAAFPLDVMWHDTYGVDATLWSPSHLQLVTGGALTTVALWLMVAEALPAARPTRLGRVIHATVAGAVLVGVTTYQGEFDFGVPSFQLLFLPLLIAIGGTFTLVLGRIALGRGGALVTVFSYLVLRVLIAVVVGGGFGHTVPRFPLYLATAVAVEAAAWAVGTDRRLRFAVVAGALAGTAGLVVEFLFVRASGWIDLPVTLLPKAALVGTVAAVAAALLAAGLGRAFSRGASEVPTAAFALAAVALLGALAYPAPRNQGDVSGIVRVERTAGLSNVEVRLRPADAADGATLFSVTASQGGDRVMDAPLREVAPGAYVTTRPVTVGGRTSTVIHLQRGDEVMTAPVHLPPQPEDGFPGVPAQPRREVAFTESVTRLIPGAPLGPAILAFAGLGAVGAVAAASFALAASRIRSRPEPSAGSPAPPAKGVLASPRT